MAKKNAHVHPDPARVEARHYQDELSDCRIALGETTQHLAEARRSVAKLTESLGGSQISTVNLEREIVQLKATVQVKEAEIAAAKEDVSAALKLAEEGPKGHVIVEHEKAMAKLVVMQKRLDELEPQLAAARADLEKAETAKRALGHKETTLTFELREANEKIRVHDAEKSRLQATCDQLRARVAELDNLARDSQRDVRELNLQVRAANRAFEEQRARADAIEDQGDDVIVKRAFELTMNAMRTFDDLREFLLSGQGASKAEALGQVRGLPVVAGSDYVVIYHPNVISIVTSAPEQLVSDLKEKGVADLTAIKPEASAMKANGSARDAEEWPISTPSIKEQVRKLLAEKPMTMPELKASLGRGESTIFKALKALDAHSAGRGHGSGPGAYRLPAI